MTHEEARLKIKKHLKTKGHEPITVSPRLIRYWWKVLNQAVFYGKLKIPTKIFVQRVIGGYAEICPYVRLKNQIKVSFQEKFVSRHLFLAVLVHEMVHAWEHMHYTTMGHGKRFFMWKGRIKRTVGLPLEVALIENEFKYE